MHKHVYKARGGRGGQTHARQGQGGWARRPPHGSTTHARTRGHTHARACGGGERAACVGRVCGVCVRRSAPDELADGDDERSEGGGAEVEAEHAARGVEHGELLFVLREKKALFFQCEYLRFKWTND